jgi:transposase-like protein
VRLILDGTVVRVRLDRRATSISLLLALGVRTDGQKVLLAIRSMGGESEAAWRALLDDLVKRALKTPELVIADGPSPKFSQFDRRKRSVAGKLAR